MVAIGSSMRVNPVLYLLLVAICVADQFFEHDRDLIRKSIIQYRLKRSSEFGNVHDGISRLRIRRQASAFPNDDEDFINGGGFGSGYDSDDEPLPPDVETEITPSIPDSRVTNLEWGWYRCTVNFLNSIEYTSDLQDYKTETFHFHSDKIMLAVEEYLQQRLEGYTEATPLMFTLKSDGNVYVLIDVGACSWNTMKDIENHMRSLLRTGRISNFSVSEDGFSIRQVGSDPSREECQGYIGEVPSGQLATSVFATTTTERTPPDFDVAFSTPSPSSEVTVGPDRRPYRCTEREATCSNGQCIDRRRICDGTRDCADGSDEPPSCGNSDSSKCDPTEFLCAGTGLCAQKLWRCDGDDDCGDGYDELNCPSALPGSVCRGIEFECFSDSLCVPASYQCDGEPDCTDSSDERGCAKPVVTRPPKKLVNVFEGETVVLDCEASGVPTPVISWRLNWGNVGSPPRVSMVSSGGKGRLTITDARRSDQGAYTCEAINSEGSIFAVPDAVLIVDEKDIVGDRPTCPAGEFGVSEDNCRPCYCFNVTDQCEPLQREYDEVGIVFTSPDDLGYVELKPAEVEGADPTPASEPINRNQILVKPAARELQLIDLSKRFLAAAHYWSLPAQFLGAKINSYGGTLTFTFSYNNSYNFEPKPTNHSDVILAGANGKTLVYHDKGKHPEPKIKHEQSVALAEDDWTTPQGTPATREDMLNILNNVDKILLRTVYDNSMLSTGIGDIRMTVADAQIGRGTTGIPATSVEECICPPGYEGLSCQYCAPGYQRITVGPFIGTCEKIISTEKEPDECPLGYTGIDCNQCSEGYRRINDECVMFHDDIGCHDAGTKRLTRDGECECKAGTEGENCDRCRQGHFYLSEGNTDGCISCFCMGVTTQCASTRRNRYELKPSYNKEDRFLLINAAATRSVHDHIEFVNQRGQYLVRAQLGDMPRDVYFWELPAEFTGDQVSAYGGSLHYTIDYNQRDGAQAITRIGDVRIIGNDITLEYISGRNPRPGVVTSYDVLLIENQWVRPDGSAATREHLMMALADIEYFMIRATYSSDMLDTMLSEISLETAVPRFTGNRRAVEVEECFCPPGYTGLSCEDCAPGYHRSAGRFYLGTCVKCLCNGHSDSCDTSTGECLECQHNTEGDRCERCIPGFYGDPRVGSATDCRPCPCPLLPSRGDRVVVASCILDVDGLPTCDECPPGYEGRQCDKCEAGTIELSPGAGCRKVGSPCQCDPDGSVDGTCDADGQCNCKESVEGLKCDSCKPSYFYFSVENTGGGCLPCFCMGVTKQCRSSDYARNKITADFSNNFGGFALTNRVRSSRLTSDLYVRSRGRVLSSTHMNTLPRGIYYWQLPDEFLGDKVVSYGGELRYTVSYTPFAPGAPSRGHDVIIIGNDIMLVASMDDAMQPREKKERVVVFREQYWRRADDAPATREHLLMALADLEDILILATYSTTTSESTISNVSMETSSENEFDGADMAYEVEHCTCPDGYEGLSCEDCSPGYTRSGGGFYLGLCQPCQCNGHADLCDSETGECENCQDNTAGRYCNECVPGYYSMSSDPADMYCQPCACPGTGENSFSETCEYISETRNLVCSACQEGYEGARCENCAEGYEGNPRIRGGKCSRREIPDNIVQRPPVVTVTPSTLRVAEGKSATISCDVRSTPTVRVMWRMGGSAAGRPIPDAFIISNQDHSLTIPRFTRDDAGTYECIAQNQGGVDSDQAVLTVAEKRPMMQVRVEEPVNRRLRTGTQVTFVCTAQSEMNAYIIYWSKRGGRLPKARATDFNGILHITDLTEEDSGTYVCTGSNMYEIDQKTATLTVVKDSDAVRPSVVIEPARQVIREGEEALFRCSADGTPPISIEWRPSSGEFMPETAKIIDGELYIPSVDMDHSAVFYCRASNAQGVAEATALLDVTAIGHPPSVTVVTPTQVSIREGANIEMRCEATGLPRPLFSWRRLGSPGLPGNAEPRGGTLQLINIQAANEDTYICTARNAFGDDSGSIHINVTTIVFEKPICKTDPETLTAYVGADASITCVAEGDPLPSVTWVRSDGLPLQPNTKLKGNKLTIENVTMANAGQYLCIATNPGGTTRSEMTLTVEDKPLPQVEILPRSQQVVEVGQSAAFTCKPVAGHPVEVTWSRTDRKPFTERTKLEEGGVITFTDVTQEDGGSYLCIAKNVVGYREVATLLTVIRKPILTVEPSADVYLRKGTSVRLRCNADGIPTPNVAWKRVSMFGQHIVLTRYQRYSNEILVRHTDVGDMAQYVCVAASAAGDAQKKVTVTVGEKEAIVRPEVVIEKSVTSSVVGGRVQLRCAATGNPKPDVIWTKKYDQLPTGSSQSEGILIIPRTTQRDAGQYICKAGNTGGHDSAETTLRIIVIPKLTLNPAGPIIHIASGDSAVITCNALEGTAPITYLFSKVSGDISSNILTSGGRMQVVSFNTNTDAGKYACTGRNEAGASTIEFTLLPLDAPSVTVRPLEITATVGELVKLECVSDRADDEILWQRVDSSELDTPRVSQANGFLRIEAAQKSDEGEYKCVATNDAGSSSQTGLVRIQVPPKANLEVSANAFGIRVGDAVKLTCTGQGDPTPRLTITKNDAEVLAAEDGILSLDPVSSTDAGRYACVAVNDAGSDVHEIVLDVKETLTLSIIPDTDTLDVTSGDDVAISCIVTGTDLPVNWSREGGELPSSAVIAGNVVQIDNIEVDDRGKYICTATAGGQKLKKSINIATNAFIPYFTQSPTSYMSLAANANFRLSLRITVSFRPNSLSGLLVYSYGSGGDYMSIALRDGKVEFRYNVGSGDAVIVSASSVNLGEWHSVTVSRHGREGQLVLDQEDPVYGASEGSFRALNLDHSLYIGGFPTSIESLPTSLDYLGRDVGFYGCISQVIIGDDSVDIGSSELIEEKVGIVQCKTCGKEPSDSPCKHNSSCVVTHSSPKGYTCGCSDEYVGPECQFRKENICGDIDVCGPHGSCTPDYERELGYRCECFPNFSGPKCQSETSTPLNIEPLFDDVKPDAATTVASPGESPTDSDELEPPDNDFDDDVIILPTESWRDHTGILEILNRNQDYDGKLLAEGSLADATSFEKRSFVELAVTHSNQRQFDVTMRVKVRSLDDGLILYSSGVLRDRKRDAEGDIFVSIAVLNKSLEFRYNCGSGLAVLTSPASILLVDQWHTIHANRANRQGILKVDGVVVAEGQSPKGGRRAELDGPLFIGGVEFWDGVPEEVGVRDGFEGCVEQVFVDGIYSSLTEAANRNGVESCAELDTTTALPTEPVTTEGVPSTVADDVNDEYSIIYSSILFLHSGRPAAKRQPPAFISSARFGGNSFVAFPEESFPHQMVAEQLSVNFRTTDPDGILLIHGQVYSGNFIMLGLRNARVEYSFQLGSSNGKAVGDFPVADGQWHRVTVVRRDSVALMWIDDLPRPVAVQGKGELSQARNLGYVYIGGAEDIAFHSGDRYKRGFRGCIADVRFTSLDQVKAKTIGSTYFDDSDTVPIHFDGGQGRLEALNISKCRPAKPRMPRIP